MLSRHPRNAITKYAIDPTHAKAEGRDSPAPGLVKPTLINTIDCQNMPYVDLG